MNIRQLIREEVARSIPFEHKVMVRRDTAHESSFHLGSKAITAKEMGLEDKHLQLRPVDNVPSPEHYARIKANERTERQKDFDRFMEKSVGGPLKRALVEKEPEVKLGSIMCGAVMTEVKVNRIFKDLNDNHVFHVDKALDPENFWIKPWTESKATPTQLKVMEALEKVNKEFGTLYFIEVCYPKNGEEIFVVKYGDRDAVSKEPVTYGQFLNFSDIIEEQQRVLRAMEAMNGLDHMTSDNTPWRLMTEPITPQQARVAIVGTSHRNA